MLPADQRFGAYHLSGTHIHLGLVVQNEFSALQGQTYFVEALAQGLAGDVVRHIKKVVTVFAGLLGLVHGLIGVPHQQVGVGAVLRIQGYTHAGGHLQHRIAHRHGLGRGLQQPLQHRLARSRFFQVHQHSNKFIPANARQRVAFTQGRLHALGQCHQQVVSHVVPMGVVDCLEAVKVQKRDREAVLAPLALRQSLTQAVGQQHPVRQTGQCIEMGNALQLALLVLHRCDVGKQRDIVLRFARRIAHGTDGQQFGVHLTVLAPVPHFAAPMPLPIELLPHLRIKVSPMAARLQQAGILPNRFLAGVAGDAAEGVIHFDDGATRIGNGDALARMCEDTGSEFQPPFSALAFGNVLARRQRSNRLAMVIAQNGVVPRYHPHLPVGSNDVVLKVLFAITAARHHGFKRQPCCTAMRRRQEIVNPVKPHQILLGVTQHLFSLAVHQGDVAACVEGDQHDTSNVQVALGRVTLPDQCHGALLHLGFEHQLVFLHAFGHGIESVRQLQHLLAGSRLRGGARTEVTLSERRGRIGKTLQRQGQLTGCQSNHQNRQS